MSYYDYKMSVYIALKDYPFYAIIMAAMRQADTDNAEALRGLWPTVWEELQARYNAPGGVLPGEEEGIDEPLTDTLQEIAPGVHAKIERDFKDTPGGS